MLAQSTILFDPLQPITKEFLQNPYPTMRQLQKEAPVYWSDKGNYWLITKYADAYAILHDLHYKKGIQRSKLANFLLHFIPGAHDMVKSVSHWMLTKNPPEHTRLRTLVNKAFTPTMVNKLRLHIQEITNSLLDLAQANGEMELVSEFAFILPVTVIAEMLGIPSDDRDKFRDWSRALVESFEPKPSANLFRLKRPAMANRELIDYLRPLVNQRRKNPQDDLISALVAAEQEGAKLTEDELLANCVLLLVAGHETTVNLISNGVLALLQHKDQFELLKKQPQLITTAIDEFLRFESPVQIVRRIASSDLELHGHKIRQEDMLILLLGACNRDPDQFHDPDTLDITRKDIKHLAFGQGIHHCLGAALAHVEGEIAIGTLIQRFPNISLKSTDIEYKQPFSLRGPKAMFVNF